MNKIMRKYYVTVWNGDFVEEYDIKLSENEKANAKTFRDKIRAYDYESIIAWSLVEK